MADIDLLFTMELKEGHTYCVVIPDNALESGAFMEAIKNMAATTGCRFFVVEAGMVKELEDPETNVMVWYDRGYQAGYNAAEYDYCKDWSERHEGRQDAPGDPAEAPHDGP